MTCRKNNPLLADGFTLIELIIVLVIIAMAAAVSIPRVGSLFETTSFRKTVNKVIVFLRDARVDAISTGKKISVVVDSENGKLVRLTDGGEVETQNIASLQLPDEVEVKIEREDKFKDENVGFAFYPNGTASGPRLLLKNTERGKSAIIYLEPLAGFIRYKIGVSEERDQD